MFQDNVFLLWLLLFAAAFYSCCCVGSLHGRCSEIERKVLLQFKQDLHDPSKRLASWTGDGDCCGWFGVICHNSTGNVLEIHLGGPYSLQELFEDYDDESDDVYEKLALRGKINPSLLSLKQLRHLDLSNNNFSGIPRFLGSMKNLRVLNLSGAGFEGIIPHELGNLSNLQYLNLDCSYSDGFLFIDNMRWLSGLSSIELLDLSGLDLSKALNWLEVINSLPSLVELHLSYCELPRIPSVPSVNLSSLSILDLSGNRLNESFPSLFSWISELKSLSSLNLGYNSFQGPIPYQFQNLTSLKQLDLSFNSFSSSMPDWLYSFRDLELLNLAYNQLQGNISSAISNLTALRTLDLSGFQSENISLTSFQNLCNLKSLSLSRSQGMNAYEVIGDLLGCLADGLESLDLRGCQLNGPIPISYCKFTRLRNLHLSDNNLNGSLPTCFGELANLESLLISDNLLEGIVSEVHLANLTNLKVLDANWNKLMLEVSLERFLLGFGICLPILKI